MNPDLSDVQRGGLGFRGHRVDQVTTDGDSADPDILQTAPVGLISARFQPDQSRIQDRFSGGLKSDWCQICGEARALYLLSSD